MRCIVRPTRRPIVAGERVVVGMSESPVCPAGNGRGHVRRAPRRQRGASCDVANSITPEGLVEADWRRQLALDLVHRT
ncbi:hypothetical protein BE17_19735 [Sorangium cellulosum]|uniref:Uncharacterized protein n=1 Tax=Sorangium cellulosum TaxID=56 RepID=A0A150SAU7_SORCE|nr:hypothetical protein BE17_19735 [Sorangium cellulosum]